MVAAIGAFDRVRDEALRFRNNWRKAQRKAQTEIEAAGMPWEVALELTKAIGTPGDEEESQASWLKMAQAWVGRNAAGLTTIDWNAFIQALLANLPALLAICGL